MLCDPHKYVWLASPDRPDFCSKAIVRWSVSIKIEKKLKGRYISIATCWKLKLAYFSIETTWKAMSSPNLTFLTLLTFNFLTFFLAPFWQWLAALKSGSHVSWRRLCVLFRICYPRYLKLVVVFQQSILFVMPQRRNCK